MEGDVLVRFANFYKDTRMNLQERTKQAAIGTVFEGQYPDDLDKQRGIHENLEWMIQTAKDPEAVESARRVLGQNAAVQQNLSWG